MNGKDPLTHPLVFYDANWFIDVLQSDLHIQMALVDAQYIQIFAAFTCLAIEILAVLISETSAFA